MPAFAIIETGGKQHLVFVKTKLRVEKLATPEGSEIIFDKVLLLASDGGGGLKIGKPFVAGAKVAGKVLKQGRGRKLRILKYKAKVRYRRRLGHRQSFTEVEIASITE